MVGILTMNSLNLNLLLSTQWKNVESQSACGEITTRSIVLPFFQHKAVNGRLLCHRLHTYVCCICCNDTLISATGNDGYRTSRWTSTFVSTGTIRDSISTTPARRNCASATRCWTRSGGRTRSSPTPSRLAFTRPPPRTRSFASALTAGLRRVCG